MKLLRIIVIFSLMCLAVFEGRAQAPTNGYPPAVRSYGNQNNRSRSDSAQHVPHKYALTQNTTDSTPQIFAWSTPSGDSLVLFVNGRYIIVGTGGGGGGGSGKTYLTGYGLTATPNDSTFAIDTLHYRKLDSLYGITDSTVGYYLNGAFHTFKIKGLVTGTGFGFQIIGGLGLVDSTKLKTVADFNRVRDSLNAALAGKMANFGSSTGFQEGLYSGRPAASGNAGLYYVAKDSAAIFWSDGSGWTCIARAVAGISAINVQYSVQGAGTVGSPLQLVGENGTVVPNQKYGSRWDGTRGYEYEGTDYYNLGNLGLDTTGATDISAFITAALIAHKRTIYIPVGTFRMSNQISLPDSTTIVGSFRRTTIRITQNSHAAFKLGAKCNIYNMSFKGSYGAGTDTSQIAILMDSVNECRVIGCNFDSCGTGVFVTKNGLQAGDNKFSLGNIISQNIGTHSYYSIKLAYRAEYNVVTDNLLSGNAYGILQVGGNNIIRNNNANSGGYGCYVSGYDNPSNNHGHNEISGNDFNHNTYPFWGDSIYLGLRLSNNMMYFGEVHLRKCQNVTIENCDISGGVIAGEGNVKCFIKDCHIRLTTYNLNINSLADELYFVNNYYEGVSVGQINLGTPDGVGGLAIKWSLDTLFKYPFTNLPLAADAAAIASKNQTLFSMYNASLGHSDSHFDIGTWSTSSSDWLTWVQNKAHSGDVGGLLITSAMGSDANSAYYSAGYVLNSTNNSGGTLTTGPLLKVENNQAEKFFVGPTGIIRTTDTISAAARGSYTTNLGSTFTTRSWPDKGYVDSMAAARITAALTNTVITGSLTSQHSLGSGSTPTTGTLGTNVTSLTASGTDKFMTLTLVTSGAVSGTLGIVTYNAAWPSNPITIICPANSTTATAITGTTNGYIIINGSSTTTSTVAGAILSAGTYVFNVYSGSN